MLPSISGTTPRGNVVIVVGGAVDERARARARAGFPGVGCVKKIRARLGQSARAVSGSDWILDSRAMTRDDVSVSGICRSDCPSDVTAAARG